MSIRLPTHLFQVRLALVVPGLEARELGDGVHGSVEPWQVLLLLGDVLERLTSAESRDQSCWTHLIGGKNLGLVGHGWC